MYCYIAAMKMSRPSSCIMHGCIGDIFVGHIHVSTTAIATTHTEIGTVALSASITYIQPLAVDRFLSQHPSSGTLFLPTVNHHLLSQLFGNG